MSDIKSVQLYVPAPVIKNRRSRKQKGDDANVLPDVAKSNPVPTPTIPVAQLAGGAKKEPILVLSNTLKQKAGNPMPVLSTTSVVGGKKMTNDKVTNDKKIISDNKPVIQVAINSSSAKVTYNESPLTPSPVKKAETPKPVKIMQIKKPMIQTRKAPEPTKVVIQPMKNRPNKTLKKKFTAKRITIQLENSSIVRKTRDAVRRNVANMSLNEITKKLKERGLIRETANPPESIQRSMMIDILLFPAPM